MLSRCTAYTDATDAVITSILGGGCRLIAVDGVLTNNGNGYVITDPDDPTKLWDADGKPWQSRVYSSTPNKYKLVLEEYGYDAK